MKTKLKTLTLLIAVFVIIAPGCKKYDDGPTISLLTKKARLVNTWKVDKIYQNGVDVTSNFNASNPGFKIEFKKDGTVTYSDNTYAVSGTWDFDNGKEAVKITFSVATTTVTELKILRLKNKELWTEEVDGTFTIETHYTPK